MSNSCSLRLAFSNVSASSIRRSRRANQLVTISLLHNNTSYFCKRLINRDAIEGISLNYNFDTYLSSKNLSSSTTFEKEYPLHIPSLSPSSLNILSLIPDTSVHSICQLPEVESVLNTIVSSNEKLIKNSNDIINSLERASQIFEQFGQKEYDAVLALQVHFCHDEGLHEECAEKLNLIRKHIENDTTMDRKQNLWSVIQLQAKSKWYNGSFKAAESFSTEATDLAPNNIDTFVALRQGCSINGLALSKIASLNVQDEFFLSFHRDNNSDKKKHW